MRKYCLLLLGQLLLVTVKGNPLVFLETESEEVNQWIEPIKAVQASAPAGNSGNDTGVTQLPPHLRHMSETQRWVVLAYSLFFVLGATGNMSVFISVCRQLGKLKWRITILIVHLSVADLIVTFTVIPSEVFWRLTVQWYGGNELCKILQFLRAFGLYLSSMILICISLDRFFAILHPLKMVGATRRVKGLLVLAWTFAALFSAPQLVVFRVQSHPEYKNQFRQCVSLGYFESPRSEMFYNVLSLAAMYFVPLLVILFTYVSILWKIRQKAREHHQAKRESLPGKELLSSCSGGSIICTRNRLVVLRSTDSAAMMARAQSRTLRLTFIIVLVFVFCWTPYAIMLLWYMFDRESASRVDERIQDGLFMMVVANSCLNPLVYGNYTRETQGTVTSLCFHRRGSLRRPTEGLPITSVI